MWECIVVISVGVFSSFVRELIKICIASWRVNPSFIFFSLIFIIFELEFVEIFLGIEVLTSLYSLSFEIQARAL